MEESEDDGSDLDEDFGIGQSPEPPPIDPE